MQQCQHEQAGGRVGPPAAHRAGSDAGLRHRALMLIGPRRGRRIEGRLARRVLDRLLQPAAQVEGVDLHLADPRLADLGAESDAFILLLPPLGNLSNPFYAVHPRRNDRFVVARDPLRALYPEVDFASFAFTGHALGTLAATCPQRFAEVRRGLAAAWGTRMRLAIDPDDRAAGADALRMAITGRGR